MSRAWLDVNGVVAFIATFAMGGLLGLGVGLRDSRALVEPEAAERGILGSRGPAGGTGVLPPLPPGLSLDSKGIVRALDLKVAPGSVALPWDVLTSYEYAQAAGLTRLPDALAQVDGRRVTMVGFLMPLYEFDDMHQFLLVGSHWSCCFGIPPGMNGAVNVTLDPRQPGMPNTMEPLRVVGTFRVKEVREEGWLVSIFSLEDAEAGKLD